MSDDNLFVWHKLNEEVTGIEMPHPRDSHSCIVYEDKMIMFGGNASKKPLNDVYSLDLDSLVWEKLTTTGTEPEPRHSHSAVLYGAHEMVIFGGFNITTRARLNDLHILDLETLTWRREHYRGDRPQGRCYHGCVLHNETKMYIFGGYNGKSYLNDLYCIDLENFECCAIISVGAVPSQRCYHSCVLNGDTMLMFGGFGDGNERHNDLHELNLLTFEWTEICAGGDIPSPRRSQSCVMYNGNMVMYGGYAGNALSDIYIYDPDCNMWTKAPSTKEHATRAHSCVIHNNSMVVFGGYVRTCLDDLYIMELGTGNSNSYFDDFVNLVSTSSHMQLTTRAHKY